MAKRITQSRVMKYVSDNKGVFTGTSVVIGLFALIVFLGAGEVTGFSSNEECAGTINDPCWLILNMTFKEDVFIYPFNNSALVLGTDQPLKKLTLYRSWGKGWREIKLNQTCKGTWCGGTGSVNKYVFAFREGRDYTLKFEALKYDAITDINWFFNPNGRWKGVKPDISFKTCTKEQYFISETDADCSEVKIFNKTLGKNTNITKCTYTYRNVTAYKCVKDKKISLNEEEINITDYKCSLQSKDTIECDSIIDGNGDGTCNRLGGESCIIRRYTNDSFYYESYTNSEIPNLVPSKNKKSRSVLK